MDLTEFKDSIMTEVKNRAISPFFWTFLLSWCAVNWKLVYILLFINEEYVSFEPLKKEGWIEYLSKIEYIDKLNLLNYIDLIWIPLLITLFVIILIYPFSQFLYQFIFKHVVKRGLIWIDWKERISLNESNKIKEEIRWIEDKFDEKIRKKDQIISDLRTEKEEIEDRVEVLAEKKSENKITELNKKLTNTRNELKSVEEINTERLQENKLLNNKVKELNSRIIFLEKELWSNSNKDNTGEDQFKEEYKKFKQSKYYKYFPEIVIWIELDYYKFISNTVSRYYLINDIIGQNSDWTFYLSTSWEEFLKYFYDEEWADDKLIKVEEKFKKEQQKEFDRIEEDRRKESDDISVEDLPF